MVVEAVKRQKLNGEVVRDVVGRSQYVCLICRQCPSYGLIELCHHGS